MFTVGCVKAVRGPRRELRWYDKDWIAMLRDLDLH